MGSMSEEKANQHTSVATGEAFDWKWISLDFVEGRQARLGSSDQRLEIMTLPSAPDACKVYTPAVLADAMVHALGDDPCALWLEPSHGTGVFINAIARLGTPKERIVALDLDRTSSPADGLATTLRGVDFLRWANQTELRFDRIVGNPPFIAINRLPQTLQNSAVSVPDFNGRLIGRGANVWYAFVLASLRLLKPGGHLAFVLPSAAEFANCVVST